MTFNQVATGPTAVSTVICPVFSITIQPNSMKTINRSVLIKVHLLLAAFIFPVALMFIVTGAFYTLGIKGSYNSEVYVLPLDKPLTNEKLLLVGIVEHQLQRLAITPPSGKAAVKKTGTSFLLEWTGSKRDILLEPTPDDLLAKLTVKETSWYRNFVQLHKAKGGQLFKVYAAVLASSLFIILLSGFIMAWQIPKYRTMALMSSTVGLVIFIILFSLS